MKFEQPRFSPEPPQTVYVVEDKNFREKKLNRDDILQEAALLLDADPKFPDARGENANRLRAKRAIREALKKNGAEDCYGEKFEHQIDGDAYTVLDLLKK